MSAGRRGRHFSLARPCRPDFRTLFGCPSSSLIFFFKAELSSIPFYQFRTLKSSSRLKFSLSFLAFSVPVSSNFLSERKRRVSRFSHSRKCPCCLTSSQRFVRYLSVSSWRSYRSFLFHIFLRILILFPSPSTP